MIVTELDNDDMNVCLHPEEVGKLVVLLESYDDPELNDFMDELYKHLVEIK